MTSRFVCILFIAFWGARLRSANAEQTASSIDKVDVNATNVEHRCRVPNKAPHNIEKVIALCQEEIKQNLIAEALDALNFQGTVVESKDALTSQLDGNHRRKRSYFNGDERKIAGCLLQCVFKRKNALNHLGYPSVEGLVNLYTEDSDDEAYVLATIRAVHRCLNKVHIVIDQNRKIDDESIDNGNTCAVAYHVFDCVSDKIQKYCGQTP